MTVTSRPRLRRPRTGALALAAATATVLGTTALVLPASAGTASAAPAATAAIPLTGGTLDWGVKKSFRDYLTGPIAGGKITVGDGAGTNDDGSFRFTDGEGSYDTGTHAVDTAFKGSVHFYGHGGQLDIKLSDLKMVTEGTSGSITADVESAKGDGSDPTTKDDVALADLDLTDVKPGTGDGGAMTFADIPSTLTADGAEAFADFYKEGTELDPVTLNVTPSTGGGSGSGGTGGSGTSGGGSGSGSGSGGSEAGGSTGSGSSGPSGSGGSSSSEGSGSGGTEDGGSESGAIVDGNLDWGVKASFRKYVEGPIADGRIDVSDGAKKQSSGYRFPKGSGDHEAGTSLDASFEGGVRFRGHKTGGDYTLDLTFSNLKVEAEGTKGSLVADVRSKDRESGDIASYKQIDVATLKLKSGALTAKNDIVTVKAAPATLTAEGAKAFAGFYKKGDKLDPVTANVSLDENAQLPGDEGGSGSSGGDSGGTGGSGGAGTTGGAGSVGGTGSLASTGSGLPSSALLGGAAGLAVLGGLAVHAARRRPTTGS